VKSLRHLTLNGGPGCDDVIRALGAESSPLESLTLGRGTQVSALQSVFHLPLKVSISGAQLPHALAKLREHPAACSWTLLHVTDIDDWIPKDFCMYQPKLALKLPNASKRGRPEFAEALLERRTKGTSV
jgi:hypothetical protein